MSSRVAFLNVSQRWVDRPVDFYVRCSRFSHLVISASVSGRNAFVSTALRSVRMAVNHVDRPDGQALETPPQHQCQERVAREVMALPSDRGGDSTAFSARDRRNATELSLPPFALASSVRQLPVERPLRPQARPGVRKVPALQAVIQFRFSKANPLDGLFYTNKAIRHCVLAGLVQLRETKSQRLQDNPKYINQVLSDAALDLLHDDASSF